MRNKFFIVASLLFIGAVATAQTSKVGSLKIGKSGQMKIGTAKPIKKGQDNPTGSFMPPILKVVGEAEFKDPSGNGVIDADESCSIVMRVRNEGLGTGRNLRAVIKGSGSVQGLNFMTAPVDDIAVNEEREIVFPIIASQQTEDGSVVIEVALEEPNGFNTESRRFEIKTRSFRAPKVKVVDHIASSSSSRTLEKMSQFDLQVLIQNVERGTAENVSIDLKLPQGVFLLGGDAQHITSVRLRPNEKKSVVYKLIVNQAYSRSDIPVTIALNEKNGKYAEDGHFSLSLAQKMGNLVTVEAYKEEDPTIVVASLGSSVDRDIPVSKKVDQDTYVLIIANGHYWNEPHINTAVNDGEIMREYCTRTLGIPEKNITFRQDLTLVQMEDEVMRFSKTMELVPSGRYMVFYYGHGMTDAGSKETYFVPIDGSSERVSRTCYRRGDMMKSFGQHNTELTLVFLESCFSGSTPQGEMLSYSKASSGVRLEPREDVGEGNLIVFSASSGSQTANAYEKESHNLFTYCLMKELKQSQGKITLGKLFDKVQQETRKIAHLELNREQDPTVIVGPSVAKDWKKIEL